MQSVHDIAKYLLDRAGPLSAMKLQKLVYYSQAWAIVDDRAPLFPEKILAWAHGPVVYELFEQHRRMFVVSSWPLGAPERERGYREITQDSIRRYYATRPRPF